MIIIANPDLKPGFMLLNRIEDCIRHFSIQITPTLLLTWLPLSNMNPKSIYSKPIRKKKTQHSQTCNPNGKHYAHTTHDNNNNEVLAIFRISIINSSQSVLAYLPNILAYHTIESHWWFLTINCHKQTCWYHTSSITCA